ncbi:TPR repeat-containing thioredoxin TTL1-like isoform X2 [Phoenix dactylifera]|uniref:TPR repeat-containing thioredoxin TTL1-like isoform X2 n=1 Tax=Phoenix dactylifera TaxID=42345 RepID=A0A8B8ZPW8_PHODC|nr:TPR repeat-containing thioredoxin TTL1-like isoform X2 [Phoenix dactylifera]
MLVTKNKEMEDDPQRASSGCGLLVLYNNVFRRRNASSSPQHQQPPSADSPKLAHSNSKSQHPAPDSKPPDLPVAMSKAKAAAAAAAAPPRSTKALAGPARMQSLGLSGELDSMIHDHQRSKGSSTLVRASSGNVMLYGNLGNIRAPGAVTPNRNVLDYLPRTAGETAVKGDGGKPGHWPSRFAGTAIEPAAAAAAAAAAPAPEVLCRALSRRLDPEELKEMGNEEYKKGRYAEAVALYDRAILIDPDKASYWSNKAAALMGMGQLLEAVGECKEAVRIDPSYARAHHRLGTLYLRLGVAEKAIHHYKLARKEASSNDIARAQALQTHLSKCHEARKLRDWQTLLKETQSAVSAGADSAPQVMASKAEALVALQRQDEAITTLIDAPKFDCDASTKFFGASSNAYVLAVQAQVDMAAGRFEDTVAVSQRAARLDTKSREISTVAQKARAVASARSRGNDLFKASKFKEACMAYGEGFHHDPYNAILFCNRAACRSKLGQWEMAIEDCNAALNMRPSYNKARLRRADCNAKLEHWEASIQDYEALLHEMPGDEEVSKALVEAQLQLRKQRGDDIKDAKHGDNMVQITTIDQFRQYTTSPGLSVALLFSQSNEASKQTIVFMEQFCQKYPTVNFLKAKFISLYLIGCFNSGPS